MVRCQSHRDVLARPLRFASLQHQVEAPSPYRFSHTCGSSGGVEELAPVQMEPQIPMGHHPQIALTHCGKDHHGGDGVRREVLELHPIVVAERPHETAQRRAQAMAVELCEGDHVARGRPWLPVVCCRRNPLRPRR